ncbi:Uncharacterised protein [Vibrio cholerae]|nr:Uncharacterised protein [Vibrio cholerae]
MTIEPTSRPTSKPLPAKPDAIRAESVKTRFSLKLD